MSEPTESGDPFIDPRFPDRPQHPDFHRLMGVVNYLDGESREGARRPDDIVSTLIDPTSVEYMAMQRARMLHQVTGLPVAPVTAVWLDAFAAGVLFAREGGHRDD